MTIKSNRKSKKGKRVFRMSLFLVIIILFSGGFYEWTKIKKEHNENLSMTFSEINFDNLKDGIYEGYYEGGMYKWRENRIEVVVEDGHVKNFNLLEHSEGMSNEETDKLFNRVLLAKSFNIDTISGATLTSRAYLKGFENALLKAQE